MKDLSDLEIIESIRKGNHSDYSLLIDKYKNKAFSMLVRMLKNEMDAEEALQDCFLKAFNGLKDFRKDSKYSTWFYKITYNTALTILASKKRKMEQEMTSINEEFDLGAYDPEIYATTENVNQFITKMVDKLPVRGALVIILFYLDGLSMNEISAVMGLSLVNVKVLLHRSRNSLRDLLLKHNYQEEVL